MTLKHPSRALGKRINSGTKFSFTLKEILAVAIFLITIGASLYTLFKTLPHIDSLQENFHQLDKNQVVLQEDVKSIEKDVSTVSSQLLLNITSIKNDILETKRQVEGLKSNSAFSTNK